MGVAVPYREIISKPFLNKGSYCFVLRAACFILAYLTLILTIVEIMAMVVDMSQLRVSVDVDVVTRTYSKFKDSNEPTFDDIRDSIFTCLGVNLLWLTVIVSCIVGLHKKVPGLIKVFVWVSTIRVLFILAIFVFVAVTTSISYQVLVTNIFCLVTRPCFIVVFYNYARQLEIANEGLEVKSTCEATTTDSTVTGIPKNKDFVILCPTKVELKDKDMVIKS